jgi:ADP-heptose:LPS heptosyltransferase
VKILIVKLGATGDVVRTTPLLERFGEEVIWLTEPKNTILLDGIREGLHCFTWEERESVPDVEYDLIINLEDTLEVAHYLSGLKASQRFGAYPGADGHLRYTEDSHRWFDLSLISSHGREEADRLKLLNRRTYQDLVFDGLGLQFAGEKYLLPEPTETSLSGDVAIAADSGPVWPMKKWAYYADLKKELEDRGLKVNVLPKRSSLLEHLADVRNHRCLVGGDSLPMHFALGTETRCVSLFTCTSPWEIYEYGLQTKIVSPLLEEFFYQRGYDARATTAITVDEVLEAVMTQLEASVPARRL